MKNGGCQTTYFFIFIHDPSRWKRRWLWFTKVTHVLQWMCSTLLLFLFERMVLSPLVIFSLHPLKYRVYCSGIHLQHDPAQKVLMLYKDRSWLDRSVLVVTVYLGQSNLTLSDVVMSLSMVWDTRRKRMGGWLVSSWNFPVQNKNNKSSSRKVSQLEVGISILFILFTNELPESQLHLSLVRWVASHEFCFDFHIFQFQIKDLLLQGLLKPGASFLIWAQVRNREAESEAQHWCIYSQWYVTVTGSVTVIQKNLSEGFMLLIEFEEMFRL